MWQTRSTCSLRLRVLEVGWGVEDVGGRETLCCLDCCGA